MTKFKTQQLLGAAGLFVASALGSAAAQNTAPQTNPPQTASPVAPATQDSQSTSTYATGKPLESTSHEGFWGHMNPLARKKWVHRQVDPIKDRANELDQLQAKNSGDIKDVDNRATAGVNRAMTAAQAADAHAADAAGRADQANSVATAANGRASSLNGTVSNLDQYQTITSTAMPFYKGHTALTAKQKEDLDTVASALANEKGYIVEVRGYSRAGVAASQTMADSVVRYLVTAHQVPVYRIYRTGMGKATQVADGTVTEKPLTNGVRVTVLHNSLATMGTTTGSVSAPQGPGSGTAAGVPSAN